MTDNVYLNLTSAKHIDYLAIYTLTSYHSRPLYWAGNTEVVLCVFLLFDVI